MSSLLRFRMTAGGMLLELKDAHARLRACMNDMEAVTSRLAADRLEYTNARYRVSRASNARRACFNAACARIGNCGTSEELAAVEHLARLDRELMSKSAAHAARWTAQTIHDDWPGYCAASRQIRNDMALELEAEENLLFAILERRSFNAASAPPRAAQATRPQYIAGQEMRLK